MISTSTLLICGLVILVVPWLLFTEFSYFGGRWVRGLYNLLGNQYDKKWQRPEYKSQELTSRLFLEPLREALENRPEAKMLDLACGSGRASQLVLGQEWFQGTIDAVDISEAMLLRFKSGLEKLGPGVPGRVRLHTGDVHRWQPPEGAQFEVVAFLEASEFVPDFPGVAKKAAGLLKPGGLFLLTKVPAPLSWVYFGRRQRTQPFLQALEQAGFQRVEIHPWMSRYSVVWAWMPPSPEPATADAESKEALVPAGPEAG